MQRPLKITLLIVGLLLAIGLLIPYVVDVDRYRPQIQAEVRDKTGRKLEMGFLRARVFPTLGFTADSVTVGPPPGFPDVSLLTAESVRGSISFLSLLRGKVEVTSVEVRSPVLVLAKDEHGRTNYDLPVSAGAAASPAASFPVFSFFTVALDSIAIRNATVNLAEVHGRRSASPYLKLTGFNADIGSLDLFPQDPARWRARVPLSGMTAELTGEPAIQFTGGDLSVENGTATGTVEMELASAGRLKGEIAIPSLGRLLAPPPKGRGEEAGSGKFSSERLRFAPFEVSSFAANLRVFSGYLEAQTTMDAYGGTISVRARLETAAAPPHIAAEIHAAHLNLEKLAAADPATRGRITGDAELKMNVSGPLDASPMNSLTGQGDFCLRDGKLPGMQLGKSMAALTKMERILSLGLSGAPNANETTFTVIEGDLKLQGSRLYTSKTHAETNVGHGDMQGSIGFDKTFDLTGTWHLPKGSRAGAATAGAVGAAVLTGGLLAPALIGAGGATLPVPFTLKGSFEDPKLSAGGGFSGSKEENSQQSGDQQTRQQKKKFLGIFSKP